MSFSMGLSLVTTTTATIGMIATAIVLSHISAARVCGTEEAEGLLYLLTVIVSGPAPCEVRWTLTVKSIQSAAELYAVISTSSDTEVSSSPTGH